MVVEPKTRVTENPGNGPFCLFKYDGISLAKSKKIVSEFDSLMTSSRDVDQDALQGVPYPNCSKYNGPPFSTNGRLNVPSNRGELLSCSTESCNIIECKIAPLSLESGQSLPFTLELIFRYDFEK